LTPLISSSPFVHSLRSSAIWLIHYSVSFDFAQPSWTFSSTIASHARGESICQVELARKAKGIVGKFVAQGRPSTSQ
jgi:hypothetical protein